MVRLCLRINLNFYLFRAYYLLFLEESNIIIKGIFITGEKTKKLPRSHFRLETGEIMRVNIQFKPDVRSSCIIVEIVLISLENTYTYTFSFAYLQCLNNGYWMFDSLS